MFAAFSQSPIALVLGGMTKPEELPYCQEMIDSSDPAPQAFLAAPAGFGGMEAELRSPLFLFLFEGGAGPLPTQMASVLR